MVQRERQSSILVAFRIACFSAIHLLPGILYCHFCELFGFHSPGSRFLMNFLVGFPIVYGVSEASFNYVESPFMSRGGMKQSLGVRRPAALAAIILALSCFTAALVNVLRGAEGEEYSGPLVQLTERVLKSVSGVPSAPRS